MHFTNEVPSYTIDLDEPEEERWLEVIAAEKKVARRLARQVRKEMPRLLVKLIKYPFRLAYKASGGRYLVESDSWAKALGECPAETLLTQCSYELCHVSDWLAPKIRIFGCTAGLRWVSGLGMVHARNMDWSLDGMGDATRLFWFRRGRRQFVSVGVLGFVGVLSGMLPGRFSITMNWAPPNGRPTFDFGPSFLIREVLETCDTYEEAVRDLKTTPLSTSVFFVVCGTKKGQGCVIERTQKEAGVRRLRDTVLAQANHFNLRRFDENNDYLRDADDEDDGEEEEMSFLEWSMNRQELLTERLEQVPSGASLSKVASCLDVQCVLNDYTCQQMAFCPTRGTMAAWRLV